MKILVTGNRGFIGQNIVEYFKNTGHDVFGYNWGDGELKLTPDIDWVIHLGAISSTDEKVLDRVMTQNYEFTVKLLNECERLGINVQYASSASVYGNSQVFHESAVLDPLNYYAWSKYLVDRYVESKKWSNIVQGFRYFNVYGQYEGHKRQPSPFEAFKRQARDEGVIKVFEGSENIKRDFVDVKMVVIVHEKFFKIKESGIWNLGSGTARSFLSVAEEISKTYGGVIKTIPFPEHLIKNYQHFTEADLNKLHKTLSRVWA